MLKNTVTIFLLLMFLCQSFNRMVVYTVFYANQKYVAENLCVNRDKPWMHCNGQCQLNNKLADDDKQDSQSPVQKAANELSVFFLHPITFHPVVVHIENKVPLNGHYTLLAPQTFINTAFHPPAVV